MCSVYCTKSPSTKSVFPPKGDGGGGVALFKNLFKNSARPTTALAAPSLNFNYDMFRICFYTCFFGNGSTWALPLTYFFVSLLFNGSNYRKVPVFSVQNVCYCMQRM